MTDFKNYDAFFSYLYNWQTLIAGIFAIFAAFITIKGTSNIAKNQSREIKSTAEMNELQSRIEIAKVLDASLEIILNDISEIPKRYSGPPEHVLDSKFICDMRISNSGLTLIRTSIGRLHDKEIVTNFLLLEAATNKWNKNTVPQRISEFEYNLNELKEITLKIRVLLAKEIAIL